MQWLIKYRALQNPLIYTFVFTGTYASAINAINLSHCTGHLFGCPPGCPLKIESVLEVKDA